MFDSLVESIRNIIGSRPRPVRVLLVDSDEAWATRCREALERPGSLETEAFTEDDDAAAAIQARPFDVAFIGVPNAVGSDPCSSACEARFSLAGAFRRARSKAPLVIILRRDDAGLETRARQDLAAYDVFVKDREWTRDLALMLDVIDEAG